MKGASSLFKALFGGFWVLLFLFSLTMQSFAGVPGEGGPKVVESYGKLPLSFEANQGQTDARVDFLSRGNGYSLFLTPSEAVLALRKVEALKKVEAKAEVENEGKDEAEVKVEGETRPEGGKEAVLRMKLIGADPNPKVAGVEELPGRSNYFIGSDPTKWHTNIPNFAKVKYEEVYPGVDLVYYGNRRKLEYDFVVAPGVDPKAINLGFEGVERLEIDSHGDLVISLADTKEEIRLKRPIIYQEVDGIRHEISGEYAIKEESQQVSFQVAAYDTSKSLVIDPILVYSTYLGGSSIDEGFGIAVDSAGSAYVTGRTESTNFPTVNPLQPATGGGPDAFITKIDPIGSSLVYSTFLGGDGGDRGLGIAVDSIGNAYVTGFTFSANFPTANPFQPALSGDRDAFVAKLDSTGSALLYSTFLGGSVDDSGRGIAVDTGGNAYVAGNTGSTNFPTANPIQPTCTPVFFPGACGQDAFITKLNAIGSALVYSTYLGGSGSERGDGIAVDATGNAYIAGNTESADFPTANPLQPVLFGGEDAFIVKVNSLGSAFVYSTYLGGSGTEHGINFGIAADSSGNAYVIGSTSSADFPTANPLQATLAGNNDAFVAKLDPAGTALIYSTYLGGSSLDHGRGISVDSNGNAHVTGETDSTNFPTLNPFQPALGGSRDAFVAKINPAGSLIYSSYLGGSVGSVDEGGAITVDPSGNAYVTGRAGSTDFPTVNPFQPTPNSSIDAFITKISDIPQVVTVTIDIKPGSFPNSINLGSNGTVPVAIFSDTAFDATTVDPTTVTLASAPVKLKGNGTLMSSFQDVNGDGLMDLVVHVNTQALQLSLTDTEAVLEGKTFGGTAIQGTDSVRVVP